MYTYMYIYMHTHITHVYNTARLRAVIRSPCPAFPRERRSETLSQRRSRKSFSPRRDPKGSFRSETLSQRHSRSPFHLGGIRRASSS